MKKFLLLFLIAFTLLSASSCSIVEGAAGKDGKDSKDGTDGKSAYEIAQNEGFVGDVTDWLASLSGSDGRGIVSLEKTASENSTDVYTVTYTDGTQSSFSVNNGEDGKSAYEIAKDEGFEGDVNDWLLSLVGEDGENGEAGSDGKDGRTAEFRVFGEWLQWKYTDESIWNSLCRISVTESDGTSDGADADSGDGLTPQSRALLSSVTVFAEFGESTSAGAGVIYRLDKENGNAYIITNYHVVYDVDATTANGISDNIMLFLFGQEYLPYAITATYVGGSMNYDIAVLRVTDSRVLRESNAIAASISDSDKVNVMDSVIAVGNPESYGMSATTGIVSVDSESLTLKGADEKTEITMRVMRISAAVNGGNSGGGLYDEDGRLLGIVNAKLVGPEIDNIAYAIPINLAKNLADNIIYHCDGETKTSVYRVLLGITITAEKMWLETDPETKNVIKVEEVKVSELTESSLLIGKLEADDIIRSVTVDGVEKQVTKIHHLIDHVLTARVGSTVTLSIVTKDGESLDVTVTVPESALTEVK